MPRGDTYRRYWREVGLLLLSALNIFVWSLVVTKSPGEYMRVYFLDVGQGDAILIESPNKGRLLIDGGPNRGILAEIGEILPFSDRRIDIVIATHPDKDHIGGLPEVVSRYNTEVFIESGVRSNTTVDRELRNRLEENNIPTLLARRGMIIDFGDGAKLKILFPNQDVANWETNSASVVARLDYGEGSYLFTGDMPIRIENVLISNFKDELDVDVLKVGHHGSRTSTSLAFAQAVSPQYAVISSGRGNSYGHPHKEVLDILEEIGATPLNTAVEGRILVISDGRIIEVN